jgi:hypothetical protein
LESRKERKEAKSAKNENFALFASLRSSREKSVSNVQNQTVTAIHAGRLFHAFDPRFHAFLLSDKPTQR